MITKIGILEGYVDVKTLAALKGVTTTSVRDSIKRGRIRAGKFNDVWAIPMPEAERFLKLRPGRPRKNITSLAARQEGKGEIDHGNSK